MTKETSPLSPALLRRLPAYFRTLIRIYGNGKQRVSSEELATEMQLAPSQVRADMKALGCVGQRSYGYAVSSLYKTIGDILQLSDRYSAVIVGGAPIAEAIKNTQVFSVRGIKLVGFLKDGISVNSLSDICKEKDPDIIIIASETENAGEILETAENINGHVSEVWNFTEKELFSDKIKVKNIHVSDLLMLLCFEIGK